LIGLSSAIEEGSNGLAGEAPCLEHYTVVYDWDEIGYDPHGVHGIQTQDGGFVAVGSGHVGSDTGMFNAFVIKTKGDCPPENTYT
jgi:hypothetical protein